MSNGHLALFAALSLVGYMAGKLVTAHEAGKGNESCEVDSRGSLVSDNSGDCADTAVLDSPTGVTDSP